MILYIYPCFLFIFRHLTLIQWESIDELKKKKYNERAICLLAKTKALRQGAKNSLNFCRNCRGTQNANSHAGCYIATKLRYFSTFTLACHFSIPYFLIGSSSYTSVSSDIRGFSAYRAQPSVKAV